MTKDKKAQIVAHGGFTIHCLDPLGSYHAILGRPAIAKFMAVPHYTYLVLKMPSPAGVLSLQGDLKISFDCDTEAVELVATNQVPNAMMEIYVASKGSLTYDSR